MSISNRKLIILVICVFLAAAIAGTLFWFAYAGGTQVVITVDGKEYASYPLAVDRTVVIGPEDGSWHNTLRIQNGKADISESDCDNQICVMTPPLQEDLVGIIVCLPHGLVAELR